jgi:CDP-glycerol glycerophosphotransferase (TagB/SpsB family)
MSIRAKSITLAEACRHQQLLNLCLNAKAYQWAQHIARSFECKVRVQNGDTQDKQQAREQQGPAFIRHLTHAI